LPMERIAALAALEGADINEAKKVLATEATRLIHGDQKAQQAADAAQKTFEAGVHADDLPSVDISTADLANGLGVLKAFVQAGLVKSNGDARRQIKGGALKVNDAPVTEDSQSLSESDVTKDGVIKLSFGKKRHVLLRPQ